MRTSRCFGALIVPLLAFFACGGPDGDIRASGYDQSCTVDEDCVVVPELEVVAGCGGGSCSNPCTDVAINARERSRYFEDFSSTRDECGSYTSEFCEIANAAACVSGRCAAVR